MTAFPAFATPADVSMELAPVMLDAGAKVVLTFRAQGPDGFALAVAEPSLEGCEWTDLTIGGKPEPNLGAPHGGRSVAADVLRIAGLSWNLSKLVM